MGSRRTTTSRDTFERDEVRPHWFVALFGTAVTALLAYVTAVFIDLVITTVSQLPHGPLWSDSLRMPFFFIMFLIAVVLLGIPYFQRDLDRNVRTFSLFTAVFLIAYVVFRASGVINPDIPVDLFVKYVVVPFRKAIGA